MARFESPVLSFLGDLLAPLLGGRKTPCTDVVQDTFRKKYNCFQELLESNSELLRIISDFELKLTGQEVFGLAYVRSQTTRLVFHCMRMIRAFEGLSGKPCPVLGNRLVEIQEGIKAALETRPESEVTDFILDYGCITRDMVDAVGGKSANLGEIHSRVGLPIPDGFAITTAAFRAFFDAAGLWDEVRSRKFSISPEDPASLQAGSEEIQALILSAALPAELETAILTAHSDLCDRLGLAIRDARVAMRSSAIGEDGELSFAGQYLTMLNVSAERLITTYKYVVASLYTPRAMSYRLLKGIPDEGIAMSVACLQMVDSRAAGVMFTRHPFERGADRIIINAVWGLGASVVDGKVEPDAYVLDKAPLTLVERKVAHKPFLLAGTGRAGLAETPVPEEEQDAPCLDEVQILALARLGLELEAHYGSPQDVEWSLDMTGRLVVLQSRPLAVSPAGGQQGCGATPAVEGQTVLVQGGETACPGAGSGPVHLVRRDEDLDSFPPGGVLVAAQASPKFMVVMPRAQAILTDYGSVTGHMAALSREFKVPTILGLKTVTRDLAQGQEVTVDAHGGRVYAGRVDSLLAERPALTPLMAGTPVHAILKQMAALVVPLNLLDPKSPVFAPQSCLTVHDIMRYLHEMSYAEMFRISDLVSGQQGVAMRLDAPTGLDLYIIDLGGGVLGEGVSSRGVPPEAVVSAPFKALLDGLVLAHCQIAAPRPVHLKGFMSVLGEQMLATNQVGTDRFGEKSYAIISDKYVNFSSRVGYHYGVLDCYCGRTASKNYITFSFKGGAADDVKRGRRARAIALMLEAQGFMVETLADRVVGRFTKCEAEIIAEKLQVMGRLLQFTRQTDMLMTSEESVQAMADSFQAGHDHFDPARDMPR